MNLDARKSARDIVNSYTFEELERIFQDLREVDDSRKVAELICRARRSLP